MTTPLRVAHYINQFFAGIGGEEKADEGVSVREGAVGPGRALQALLGESGRVVGTVIGGDNFVNERTDEALAAVTAHLRALAPDVVVAGPAFGSGRYGLACGLVCRAAREAGLPAATAMHPENPAVSVYRRDTVIVATGESAASMAPALDRLVPLALKLGRGEALGP